MLATTSYFAHARRPRPEKLQTRPAKQIALAARRENRAQRIHARRRS